MNDCIIYETNWAQTGTKSHEKSIFRLSPGDSSTSTHTCKTTHKATIARFICKPGKPRITEAMSGQLFHPVISKVLNIKRSTSPGWHLLVEPNMQPMFQTNKKKALSKIASSYQFKSKRNISHKGPHSQENISPLPVSGRHNLQFPADSTPHFWGHTDSKFSSHFQRHTDSKFF